MKPVWMIANLGVISTWISHSLRTHPRDHSLGVVYRCTQWKVAENWSLSVAAKCLLPIVSVVVQLIFLGLASSRFVQNPLTAHRNIDLSVRHSIASFHSRPLQIRTARIAKRCRYAILYQITYSTCTIFEYYTIRHLFFWIDFHLKLNMYTRFILYHNLFCFTIYTI